MQISRVDQLHVEQARGVVMVIDVIRAFTVASYAFAGGAEAFWQVRAVEEAFALRTLNPTALLAGEVNGRLIDGFDFNNSPSLVAAANLQGCQIIQRTGAGTRGAVGAINASHLLICALTNARATVAYARTLEQATQGIVTLLPTATLEQPAPRNEDDVCADYLEALLLEREDATHMLRDGIEYLYTTKCFDEFEVDSFDVPYTDIAKILATDCFNFAMVGTRKQWQGIDYVEVRRVDMAF